jgi:hypothetical protein
MRIFIASLIVLAALYFWDQNYNSGKFTDGLGSMWRSISHNVFH